MKKAAWRASHDIRVTLIALLLAKVAAFAADSASEVLSPVQQTRLDSVRHSFRIASCDSLSIAECLKPAHRCPMAPHLADFSQWLVSKDKSDDEIKKDLAVRHDCLTSSQEFAIDLKGVPLAGDPKAPVTIVAYISAMCPLCKYICSELYQEVTSGTLKGKAKLAAKPFTAGTGDRALLAAAHFSKFWDYVAALNMRKVRPDEPILITVADSLGIPIPAFKGLLTDATSQTTLDHYHDEGIRNEVSITPTFFINGKRYRSYKDPRWVVDAALYEFQETARLRHPLKPSH